MERLRRLCQNSDKTAAKCKQRKNCENSPDFVKIHQKWELAKILQFLKIQVNYFSLIFMFKFQLFMFRNNVQCGNIERKENCPDGRRSQKDDSHTVFRWTCCTYLEQSIDHSQQRGKIVLAKSEFWNITKQVFSENVKTASNWSEMYSAKLECKQTFTFFLSFVTFSDFLSKNSVELKLKW